MKNNLLPNNRKNTRSADVVKIYKRRGRIYFALKNRQDGIFFNVELDELLADVHATGAAIVHLPNRDGSERRKLCK